MTIPIDSSGSDPSSNFPADRLPDSRMAWTTLITNTKYLTGLIALDYSLKKAGSRYPLVALYTDTFEPEGHAALDARSIYKKRIEYLLPKSHKDYSQDTRFYDCWSKLQPFSLYEHFDRVVQLDSDMIVLKNMDELMEIQLHPETAVFAASHACVCNPYKKPHYPKNWHSGNCAYTDYDPISTEDLTRVSDGTVEIHQHILGPRANKGLGICNGGLQVVSPSEESYQKIVNALNNSETIQSYDFADQSLLSDVFQGRWIPLSYKYNALKTLKTVHNGIWDDLEVKNIHYIISPKPWDVREKANRESYDETDTFRFWFEIDDERLVEERSKGLADGF